jgi:RNA polymerase sigma-70 factor (ECF subfamily)
MDEAAHDAALWLAAARAGSKDALGQALEACRGYLLLIANQELAPDLQAKGGASDLVQETFLEAQRDFAHFQGNSDPELRAWLRRVLLNNVANFTRHYRATGKRAVGREQALDPGPASSWRAGDPAADTPTPSGQAMAHEQALALQKALERLPEDYRQVIALRHQEQLTFDEIGQRLQRTGNAARLLWLRAIERLQAELGEAP